MLSKNDMEVNAHKVTAEFEQAIAEYTGAPYVVCVDNCSNALFLALRYIGISGKVVRIPSHTYPSVPCEIIHAGGIVEFYHSNKMLKGAYQLGDTSVWDSALRFTADMYMPKTLMCCSFTGPYKHLKLGKGGCILTDSQQAYEWFKRSRYSGRRECSYHEDFFDMIGWNFYMNPIIATLGLLLIKQFYNLDETKKIMPDVELPYPDLSSFKYYQMYSISQIAEELKD